MLALGVAVSCVVVDDGSIDVAPVALDADGGPGLQPMSQPLGQPCSTAAECASGFCSDGVCCDKACAAPCESCNATTKEAGAPSGVCGFRKAGVAPKTFGCQVPVGPCAASTCNGHGVCGRPANTTCAPAYCIGHTLCMPQCGVSAQCNDANCSACPNGYGCHPDMTKCYGQCTTEEQCQPDHFCREGNCATKLGAGKKCTEDIQCKMGHCYLSGDKGFGVCCETDCKTACNSCFASEQQTPGGKDGVCGPTKAEADFNEECPKSAEECGPPGWCSGSGSCAAQMTNGHGCGDATCELIGGVPHSAGQLCQGGQCVTTPDKSPCEGVANCDGDACVKGCTSDADCLPTYYCNSTARRCDPRLPPGAACNADAGCSTGYCTDGFCCIDRCAGLCEACDLAGNQGFCLAVTGEPRGARNPCPGPGPSGDPCLARLCDGVERGNCEDFVGPDTECGLESCTTGPYGSTLHPARTCDGTGKCSESTDIPCGATPSCAGCPAKCVNDEDCVPNAKCIDGECVLAKSCLNEEQVASSTGAPVSCFPYVCRNDDCLTSCNGGADCAPGAVCDVKARACVLPAEVSDEPDAPGCGCRVAPRSPGLPSWLAFALVFAGLRRRRA